MISIKDLSFTYEQGTKEALKNITLNIPEGGFTGIIGPSGAGKTTLLSAVSGIIPHHFRGTYYGSVTVAGRDTFELSLTELSQRVGTVLQDIDSQLINSVVEDELYYGLENFGVSKAEAEERVDSALKEIGIQSLRRRYINTLSGGQKQKVAIASIVALRPRILLLDEPTGELDPYSSRQIFSLLTKLNREHGITIVVVEQKIMLLSEFVRDLAVLYKGELKFYGPVREVLRHSKELEAMGINCPRVVSLSNALREEGIGGGDICVNVDEAEVMVKRALK
ncbi:MAG: ABC transporter ATP-binding protein [Papillibacter sp.]|jgi:energy-coupling factor transport system ATP-binding protein|nr:ABC transporter ATP-binding protein [Papillibacter sp.]